MTTFLPFAELEFTHAIGPATGRYRIVADQDGTADVLQLRLVEGAAAPEGRLLRRTRPVGDDDAPRDVTLLRATWIGASQPLDGKAEADDRLARLRREEDEREQLLAAVLDVLNVAVRAHRATTRDPYLAEVTRADPREVRLGYGTAEELKAGRWTTAFRPPAPRPLKLDRSQRLAPDHAVALALAGRLGPPEGEELALRVLADLDAGRLAAAALQLRAAVDLLEGELHRAATAGAADAHFAEDVAELAPRATTLAGLAVDGRLGEPDRADLETTAEALWDVLDRWRAPGSPGTGALAEPPG